MLAENFRTAEELCLTEPQHAALIRVLRLLERGRIPAEKFHMSWRWPQNHERNGTLPRRSQNCGSAVCLLGWADIVDPNAFDDDVIRVRNEMPHCYWLNSPLRRVFLPWTEDHTLEWVRDCADPAIAAHALRTYLTTGRAEWEKA